MAWVAAGVAAAVVGAMVGAAAALMVMCAGDGPEFPY